MARTGAQAAKRNDDGGARARRTGDVFSTGLHNAIDDLLEEMLEHTWAKASATPAPAPTPAAGGREGGAVLRLPVRHAAELAPEERPVVGQEAVTEAIAPLIEELGRLRAEVARLREGEAAAPPLAAPLEGRAELMKLFAGVLVCFILVAIALVIVVKA